MSNLLEVLVTSDSNNTMWTCCVWDPHNGTSLMTYKGGGTAEFKTLSFIDNDYLVAVEKAKPILHVWPLNSHQTVQGMRFVLPGKANAFAITKDGSFCAAGIDEKIYVWQIASGSLLTILNRHYQKVNLIKFTSCGRYFVSAARDGMVMVWSLAAIATHPEVELVKQTHAGQHDPVYIFSDHSLPVIDFCLSKMGMLGRLYTISSDRSCMIYDLTTGEMLLNLVFDIPLSSIELDVLELNVFIGTMKGDIYQFSLTNPVRYKETLVTDKNSHIFSSHNDVVTCLSVSLDGETLMSASNDKQLILWHIRSRQPIRTIMHKGPITNAFFTLNRPAIYTQDFKPKVILHSLERTLERDNDDITELEILVDKKINFWPEYQEKSLEIVEPTKKAETDVNKEKKLLKEELNHLKKINASLYAYSINKALTSPSNVEKPKPNKKKIRKTFKS